MCSLKPPFAVVCLRQLRLGVVTIIILTVAGGAEEVGRHTPERVERLG